MSALSHLKNKFRELTPTKKFFISILFLGLIAAAGWAGFILGNRIIDTKGAVSPKGNLISGKPQDTRVANPINGILVKKEEAEPWINRLPIGVIIENHIAARPQSGFSKADIVYEALAEGGITRCLAIFLQEDSRLGPVRSNRHYYIDWLLEYDAAYAHVGGAPDAQGLVKSLGVKDLDQFYNAKAYERVGNRSAPHNVYSNTTTLRDQASSRGYKKERNIESWKFLDEKDIPKREERPAVFNVNVGFRGNPTYGVEWRYNPDTNSYFRFNGGATAVDAETNVHLNVSTLIVQTVEAHPHPTGNSRLLMQTHGSGAVKIFLNGKVIEGSWKKDNATARTKFLDANGEEIKLNRGKIWVEIIPPGSGFTHT